MTTEGPAQRSEALLHMRRYSEAASVAREGLAQDPGDERLLALLATALIDGDDPIGGLEVANRLVAARPDWYRGHELAGWALHKSGRSRDGIAPLEHAVSLNPTNATLRVLLVEVLVRNAGGGRTARILVGAADPHVAEALRLAPEAAAPCLVASKVSLRKGDLPAARYWAEEGLRRDPNNHVGHQLLGIVAKQSGDLRAAGDHFVDAARANVRSKKSLEGLRSLFVAGGAFFPFFGSRWLARRKLSDEARAVLERDRSTQRRRRVR